MLLHQDLHGDNVLAAEREPWLAIDPKPLVGEREFGVAPIVRSRELGHSRRDVLYRFDRLVSELGLDRERARGWTIGQTIAWAFDARGPPDARRDGALAARSPLMLRAVLFDVDFTIARPGPELGPEGYHRLGRALRPRARPVALRRRARAGGRGDQAPPGARARRGDLGRLHRADHPRHGRRRRQRLRVRRRDDAGLGARGALRAVRGRAARPGGAARAGAEARARLEHGPRPRRLRGAPPPAGGRGPRLGRVRPDEAAPDDLPRRAGAARGRAGGGGDGRRLDRGRRRRRARRRDRAGVPARPREPPSRGRRTPAGPAARCRPRSG